MLSDFELYPHWVPLRKGKRIQDPLLLKKKKHKQTNNNMNLTRKAQVPSVLKKVLEKYIKKVEEICLL